MKIPSGLELYHETANGGPFKPSFGLSGAFLRGLAHPVAFFPLITSDRAAPLVAVFDEWVPVTSTLLRRDLSRASLGPVVTSDQQVKARSAHSSKTATSGAAFVRMCGPAPSNLRNASPPGPRLKSDIFQGLPQA